MKFDIFYACVFSENPIFYGILHTSRCTWRITSGIISLSHNIIMQFESNSRLIMITLRIHTTVRVRIVESRDKSHDVRIQNQRASFPTRRVTSNVSRQKYKSLRVHGLILRGRGKSAREIALTAGKRRAGTRNKKADVWTREIHDGHYVEDKPVYHPLSIVRGTANGTRAAILKHPTSPERAGASKRCIVP